MFGLLRLAAFGFIALTVVYVSLSFYSRAVRRGKLEDEWDAGTGEGDREGFIREGLAEYEGSLRRKLIWGVYVIPTMVVGAIIYVTNYG